MAVDLQRESPSPGGVVIAGDTIVCGISNIPPCDHTRGTVGVAPILVLQVILYSVPRQWRLLVRVQHAK